MFSDARCRSILTPHSLIFGRHIAKEYLAVGVLGSATFGAFALTRGGKKAEPAAGLSPAAKAREVVPITADST